MQVGKPFEGSSEIKTSVANKDIIPDKTSDLKNDSNFATNSDIPSNNKSLTNGANYIDGSYDNSSSGLKVTDIQSAIDELKSILDDMQNSSGKGS